VVRRRRARRTIEHLRRRRGAAGGQRNADEKADGQLAEVRGGEAGREGVAGSVEMQLVGGGAVCSPTSSKLRASDTYGVATAATTPTMATTVMNSKRLKPRVMLHHHPTVTSTA
jgi:hypothetical protein